MRQTLIKRSALAVSITTACRVLSLVYVSIRKVTDIIMHLGLADEVTGI